MLQSFLAESRDIADTSETPSVEDVILEDADNFDWRKAIRKANRFTDFTDIFKDVFDIDPLELPIPHPPDGPDAYKGEKTPYGLKARGVKTREKLNAQAKEIIARFNQPEDLTPEDREILLQYSGRGGLTENSQFEYYTPTHVAEGVWDLMTVNGFENGNVLDPCTGHGVFSGTKPEKGVVMTGADLDPTSSKIAQLLNPEDTIYNQSFEKLAVSTADNHFDGIVGNVPFGDARGASAHDDPAFKSERRIERYFILRALDKLKPGKLACLIVPINIVGNKGKKWEQFRVAVSKKAEFLGAHKLPSKTFSAQGTDTVVDIVVFKKHPAEFLERVEDLSIETLKETRVIWDDFVEGRWWLEEGRKFIMGKYTPKVPGDRWSREIVDGDVDNEGLKRKLALKFNSRIDWDALEVAEPVVRNFVNGDRRIINGIEFEMKDGDWERVVQVADDSQPIDKEKYGAETLQKLKALLESPQGALQLTAMQMFSIFKTWPDLMSTLHKNAVEFAMSQADDSLIEQAYRGTIIGGMLGRYKNKLDVGEAEDTERLTLQEMVTAEIEKYGLPKNNRRLWMTGENARQFGFFLNAVDEKGNFSDLLAGTIEEAADKLEFDSSNIESIVSHLFIREGIATIELEDVLKLYSGNRTLQSLGDIAEFDGVAVTPDGLIMPMSRYCAGDIYPKIQQMTDAMAIEEDARIKAKYQKQIDEVKARRKITDPADIVFGLQHKWFNRKYIVKFLQESGYRGVGYGEWGEEEREDWDGKIHMVPVFKTNYDTPFGTFEGLKDKGFQKQLLKYLNGGKVTSSKQEYIDEYKEQIRILTENFNAWMQQHPDINKIAAEYNRKFNGYLPFEYDGELKLKGVGKQVKLHDYQAAAVQRLSEEGRGCLAFDVGLGKTFSALGLFAYNKQMGRSKKTCIVVPKSVLANWYHESKAFLGNLDNVLFVGFEPKINRKTGETVREQVKDEHGKPKVNKYTSEIEYQDVLKSDGPKAVWEKMWKIPQSNVGLVVMTKEKFGSIPLRPGTKKRYTDKMVERSLLSEKFADKTVEDNKGAVQGKKISYQDDKDRLRIEQKYADEGTAKKGELPYFEDMGFDSVIVDECHEFKNSYQAGEHTKDIAYLPTAPSAKRAVDMALKMNHLRDANNGRGSYLLSATPVTNSPFEIFNMLSLVCPIEEFERFDIYTVDDFVRVFGKVESVDKVMVSGDVKSKDGLVGFQNLDGLRNLFHKYVNMKNAQDVELPLPPHTEEHQDVEMTGEQQTVYEELREVAREAAKPKSGISMFSVIRDMDRVTTDMDLYYKTMTFVFPGAQKAAVDELMATVPKTIKVKKPSEDDSTKRVTVVVEFKVTAKEQNGNYIATVPEEFEEHIITRLPNHGIEESNVGHPVMPKYAKLIANIQKELDQGKQLVFTEEKSQHNKILRIIVHQVPMLAQALGIINADTANGAKLQKISDSYNSGKTKVVIANKKAEVGVNLQKGTAAIHHLTLPWTPASIQQRNGRGVRQGNTAKHINIYYYLGKGSFDLYRLDLLKRKSNWMRDLFDGSEVEAENANALNQDEFMDMLEADPEAAKARRLERLARKQKEREEREKKRLTNVLQGMASAFGVLNSLDKLKEKERERIERNLKAAENKLKNARETLKQINQALDDGDAADDQMAAKEKRRSDLEAVISNRGKERDKLKLRQKGLEKKYEIKKTDLESKIKRDQTLLKGKAEKNELPFDKSLIDNPGNALVTLSGLVLSVGDTYEVIESFGGWGSDASGDQGSIFRISAVNAKERLFQIEEISGDVSFKMVWKGETGRWVEAEKFQPAKYKKVSYSQKELAIKKVLSEEMSYADLVEKGIDKDTFFEHIDNVNINNSSAVVVRNPDGSLSIVLMWDYEGPKSNIVFPEPKDENYRRGVFEAMLKKVRADESGYRYERLMNGVFGDNWKDQMAEYGKKLTETEIREAVGKAWNEKVENESDGAETDPEVLLRLAQGSYIWRDIRQGINELGDNHEDIEKVVDEYKGTIIDGLNAKLRAKQAEDERRRMEEVRNHPNYKEVPAPVQEAFAKLGVTVKTNINQMVIPGFRGRRGTPVAPFQKWYFQDKNGKGGVLFRTKNILKSRYGAKFFANADDEFNGAWWHLPITTDLREIYELLA